MTSRLLRAGALVVTGLALLTACSSGPSAADAHPLGEAVTVTAGEGVEMAFAVDDVREGTVADLERMGVTLNDSDQGKGAYFVTYSVTLVSGEIEAARSGELPVPKRDEWQLDGSGVYTALSVIGGSIDCTEDGSATPGVAPDAPLVGCQAFLSRPGAMPRTVTAGELGVWAPAAG